MTDRESLTFACHKTPEDNTLRRVLADFLDESATCDRDHAQAEFLRVSCPETVRKSAIPHRFSRKGWPLPLMPYAAYLWLDDNWHRLVPTIVKYTNEKALEFSQNKIFNGLALTKGHIPKYAKLRFHWQRKGRIITAMLPMGKNSQRLLLFDYIQHLKCTFDFYRGFMRRCKFPSQDLYTPFSKNLIRADWPDCEFS